MNLINETQNNLAEVIIAGNKDRKETLLISFFPLVDHVYREILSDTSAEEELSNDELKELARTALDKSLERYQDTEKDYRIGSFMSVCLRDSLRDRLE